MDRKTYFVKDTAANVKAVRAAIENGDVVHAGKAHVSWFKDHAEHDWKMRYFNVLIIQGVHESFDVSKLEQL